MIHLYNMHIIFSGYGFFYFPCHMCKLNIFSLMYLKMADIVFDLCDAFIESYHP